ncbi:glycerophosphodiester phosphodiesterase family protein [Bosea lathyri]|uniref:Glycerophosphoryl diester phosphodiesterase n=1 Tax=Bosea lathyri TaxID=1036778 RepID=A0A1H6BBF8_9HYPH|nr:glycerophosphodiester phosphodiesterase family protein [Bosea lathyri]SEG57992.1 Glycerophosphoryl diester phosphodiesterase [Bosea lathyri]
MSENSNTMTKAPLIIAHRGASAYRPEHTLEAYKLAIEQGADVIEPDMVVTKDGQLIARHENLLDGTTDVKDRAEFKHLYTTKDIDGQMVSGWFAEDFTLAEIKTLYARERIPGTRPESAAFNDQFRIPTIEEVIALVKQVEADTGRKIAIAPETKHPTHFMYSGKYIDGSYINVDMSKLLVDKLVQSGLTDRDRVYIQSFDVLNLIQLGTDIMPKAGVDFKLVQLIGGAADIAFHFNPENAALGANPALYKDFAFPLTRASATNSDLLQPEAMKAMKALYADVYSPWTGYILPRQGVSPAVDADGNGKAEVRSKVNGLIDLPKMARDAGLEVILWTLRTEESFMALNPDGTVQLPVEEFVKLFDLGLDAVFTDSPDIGRAIADQYKAGDGAIAARNTRGGNDILVRDADGLTEAKGTGARDLAVYYGDGIIELPANVEDLRLNGISDTEVVGNALDNVILGNVGDNTVLAGAGNDTVDGGKGDDELDGGDGNDMLRGGDGDDIVKGGAGDDTLSGGIGDDELDGGEGVDTVDYADDKSGVTVDLVAGKTLGNESGEDDLVSIENVIGGAGDDVLVGDDAANRLQGGLGKDVLKGGAGDDMLDGGADNDTLEGGAGDDVILAGLGDDIIDGGEGFDTLDLSAATGPVSVDLKAGKIAGAGIGNDTVRGIEKLAFGATDDVVSGGDGVDAFDGGAGNDKLNGGAGNDNLWGGAGNDTIDGGSNDDLLVGGLGNDKLRAGSGNDVVEGGAGNDVIDAGSGDDKVFGGEGDDVIDAGSGADRIEGGAGNDVLDGGSGQDAFVFGAGFGKDTVRDFRLSGANADVLEFSAAVFADFNAAIAAGQQIGADTVLTVDADTMLTLKGIQLTSLAQDDFRFV